MLSDLAPALVGAWDRFAADGDAHSPSDTTWAFFGDGSGVCVVVNWVVVARKAFRWTTPAPGTLRLVYTAAWAVDDEGEALVAAPLPPPATLAYTASPPDAPARRLVLAGGPALGLAAADPAGHGLP